MSSMSCNQRAVADVAARRRGRIADWHARQEGRRWRSDGAIGSSSGKGLPGQSTALHLRGRRCAPTSLRCSAVWHAAELASLTAFAALRQWRRVSLRSALTRAATRHPLLGAPQARRSLSGNAFAGNRVVRHAREEPSRQAVPAGGELWSDEDRRPGVGARSALRRLTRRNCPSAVSAANAASSATRPLAENRSAVGAQRRPRKHEPPAGAAWRDAEALLAQRCPPSAFKVHERSSAQQGFRQRGPLQIWRSN